MQVAELDRTGVLDEAYERLHRTGPEFEGFLANHGPMASEALVQMGLGEHVHRWLDGYTGKLEARPAGSRRITPEDFGSALGDSARFGDWLDYFEVAVTERPWRDVLVEWWPRLLPGAVASATYSLIRVGHAVRALQAVEAAPRVAELGQALGYWAARYQPLPATAAPSGGLAVVEAFDAVPRIADQTGGVGDRVARLAQTGRWTSATAALRAPARAEDVPAAIAALTDEAVTRYLTHGHGNPIMLVHASTAPNAALLILDELPTELWLPTHAVIWQVCAALTAFYTPAQPWSGPVAEPASTAEAAGQRALDNGDEHVIKFTETALKAERRGLDAGRAAAAHALHLISTEG